MANQGARGSPIAPDTWVNRKIAGKHIVPKGTFAGVYRFQTIKKGASPIFYFGAQTQAMRVCRNLELNEKFFPEIGSARRARPAII